METRDGRRTRSVAWLALLACAACGGGDEASDADTAPGDGDAEAEIAPDVGVDDGGEEDDAAPPDADVVEDATADEAAVDDVADTTDAGDEGDVADVPARVVTCADEPPAGADLPDPPPVYEGTCPTLVAGRNTIVSSGATREFLLVVPADLDPAESLPLLFLWHWLGGSAAGFLTTGDVQAGADEMRFLAAIPEEKGDVLLKWPYMVYDTIPRVEEEVRFFDDMYACIVEQFEVNTSCVSSVGVSAGGLWTPQLAQRRSRLLASFLSLSGGVGRDGDWITPVRGWDDPAPHKLPALVLWGGPSDFCGLSFATTSHYLEDHLDADGHFYVECVHNCSHAEPPMEPPPGVSKYAALWSFVLDHPFWLEDGESPYLVTGIPDTYPEWCGIGRGAAVIREGSCEGGILGDCL